MRNVRVPCPPARIASGNNYAPIAGKNDLMMSETRPERNGLSGSDIRPRSNIVAGLQHLDRRTHRTNSFACRHFAGGGSCPFSSWPNPADIAVLRRVLSGVVSELGIEPSTVEHEALAAHLLVMFEAVRDEKRLEIMIRKVAQIDRSNGTVQKRAPRQPGATARR
jgi:hypothetical protein